MLHVSKLTVDPAESFLRMGAGLWLSRAIWAAARLRVADALGDTPMDAAELAGAVNADAGALGRLLTALAASGVFACEADGRFAHSALSRYLRSDHPASVRAMVESIFGGEHYEAWGDIEHSVRTGSVAFDRRFGMPVFAWFAGHPAAAGLFAEAMTGMTTMAEKALLSAHAFAPFECAVDVGGSRGTLLQGVLERHHGARGILFDLPDIVAIARPGLDAARIEAVAGDFFASVPAGGDLYLLKQILHDWNDAQCAKILGNVRAAIRDGGRLCIAEIVLPEAAAPDSGYLMDLNMLVMTGGRERKASEFAALLAAAGFRLERVTPTDATVSMLEAIAV